MVDVDDAHAEPLFGYASAMPQRQQLTWPEGTLPAILEPFMWIATIDPVTTWPGGDTIRVTGMVRGPETVGDTGADIGNLIGPDHQRLVNGLARATREAMYKQAEDAVAAALEAGFTLVQHPAIDVGGTLSLDRKAGVDVPCAEVRVDLMFRPPMAATG
jgi:hypothetical protein